MLPPNPTVENVKEVALGVIVGAAGPVATEVAFDKVYVVPPTLPVIVVLPVTGVEG